MEIIQKSKSWRKWDWYSYSGFGFGGCNLRFGFNFLGNEGSGNDVWCLGDRYFCFDQRQFRFGQSNLAFDEPQWLWSRLRFMKVDSANNLRKQIENIQNFEQNVIWYEQLDWQAISASIRYKHHTIHGIDCTQNWACLKSQKTIEWRMKQIFILPKLGKQFWYAFCCDEINPNKDSLKNHSSNFESVNWTCTIFLLQLVFLCVNLY